PGPSGSSGAERDSRREGIRMRWPFRLTTLERTIWTVTVWFLFGLFVVRPPATVFAFSFSSSVLSGKGTFTLTWYGQLFSQPGLYGPLIRSFEIAVIVVVFQLIFGTLIAYSTVRERVLGAKTLDTLSNITLAVPSVVVGLALLSFYGPFGPFAALTQFLFANPFSLTWTLRIIVVSAVLKTAPIAIFTQAEAGSLELASAYSVVLMFVSFVAYLLMSRWLLRGESIT